MRRIDIEAMLRWAYRDELPKAAARGDVISGPGWASVGGCWQYLTAIDQSNAYGLIPDGSDGEPHPDAIVLHHAVQRLEEFTFDVPEEWNPLSDMGDLGPEGAVAVSRGLAGLMSVGPSGRELRRSAARIVIRAAILGSPPVWEGDVPERVEVRECGKVKWFRRLVVSHQGAFGPVEQEIEVDGFDIRRRRPHPGAYKKTVLEPDPAPVVEARAEYELWRAALDVLVEDLDGACQDHVVLPSARPWRPWESPAANRRVLPSLLTARGKIPAPA